MSLISEKVSYLQGLAEGMRLSTESNEGKLLAEIIKVLGSISDRAGSVCRRAAKLFDKVFSLEDEVYGEEEDGGAYEMHECEDDEEFSLTCPSCGEEFFLAYEDLESDEDLTCPSCGQEIELDLSCDGDCGGCSGCGE